MFIVHTVCWYFPLFGQFWWLLVHFETFAGWSKMSHHLLHQINTDGF